MTQFGSSPYEESNSGFDDDNVVNFPLQPNAANSDATMEERVEEHDRKSEIHPKSQPDIEGAKAALSKLEPEPREDSKTSAKESVRQIFPDYYQRRQLGVKHSAIQKTLIAQGFNLSKDHGRNYYNQLERELKAFVAKHSDHLKTLEDEQAVAFITSKTRIPINEAILHDLLLERELEAFVAEHAEHLLTLQDEQAVEFITNGLLTPIHNEVFLLKLLKEVLRTLSKQSKKEQAKENSSTGESPSSSNSPHTRRNPLKSKTDDDQKSEFHLDK